MLRPWTAFLKPGEWVSSKVHISDLEAQIEAEQGTAGGPSNEARYTA